MNLTILGSGTGVPSATRGGPGYLVQHGEARLLLDLGMGALAKLDRLGVSLKHVGPLLISHLHPDHTAELVSLLFALKNLGIGRRETLRIRGGQGLGLFLRRLGEVYGHWIRPEDFDLQVREMEGEEVHGDLRIRAVPVRHTEGSVGFRITDPSGKVLAYTGDTEGCPALTELLADADLAVVDCSFPDEHPCPGHMTPSEAGGAAEQAGVRRLVLSHFYPECREVDLASQCRRRYGGEIILAQDLMTLPL